jgi:hypothetical protein
VLTLDKDFWQITVQRRSPLEQSGVVLFRVHPATTERCRASGQIRPMGDCKLFGSRLF